MARQNPPKKVPHTEDSDPKMAVVAFPLAAVLSLADLTERKLEGFGLYFAYMIFLTHMKRMPTVKELTEMGFGSSSKISAVRKVLIREGWLKDVFVKQNGKIVARKTQLTTPKFKFPRFGFPYLGNQGELFIIINNNKLNTPANGAGGVFDFVDDLERENTSQVNDESPPPKKKRKVVDYRQDEFERFYKSYPRKKNKPQAFKNWKTAINQKELPPIEFILARLDRFKEEEWSKVSDDRYIPHPGTWISGRQWNDVLEGDDEEIMSPPPTKPKKETSVGEKKRREFILQLVADVHTKFGFWDWDYSCDDEEELRRVSPLADALLELYPKTYRREAKKFLRWMKASGYLRDGLGRRGSVIAPPDGRIWKEYVEADGQPQPKRKEQKRDEEEDNLWEADEVAQ